MKMNYDEREQIVFGEKFKEEKYYMGGIRRYKNLDLARLNELIEKGYADVDERQNYSPTIGEIRDFMEEYPNFTAHGYVVSPNRMDSRVSIEGVENRNVMSVKEMMDAMYMFRYADDLSYDMENCSFYCWYD